MEGAAQLARYIAGRLAQAALALWLVASITFVLMHAIPGDPFASLTTPAAIRALLDAKYGLDLPLSRQYGLYLWNLAHGRLGWSLIEPQWTVGAMIRAGFPVSAALGLEALAWSVPLGVILGLAAATDGRSPTARHPVRTGAAKAPRRGPGVWRQIAAVVSIVGLALPSFVLAVVADYALGARADLLPVAGWGTPAQTVLPALALGALPLALVSRMTRAQALEVVASDYVRAARAKGLSWPQVLRRHVLRNALLPVLTLLGPLVTATVAGSFVVETVFAIPGLGSAFVSSVLDRDYPLILGLTVFYATLLLLCNLLVDLAYLALDPRVGLAREGG